MLNNLGVSRKTHSRVKNLSVHQNGLNANQLLVNNFAAINVTNSNQDKSSSNGNCYYQEILNKLIENNLVENCVEVLFTRQDERYLIYILENIPQIID